VQQGKLFCFLTRLYRCQRSVITVNEEAHKTLFRGFWRNNFGESSF
jgi:hypothetical protein